MKKYLVLVLAAMFATTLSFAQNDKKDYKKDRSEWEARVKDELKLTPEQAVKFDAVCREFNDKLDAVAQDASSTKEAQADRKKALKKEKEAKLFEFLTPEQQAKYRQLVEEKKKSMEPKPAGS